MRCQGGLVLWKVAGWAEQRVLRWFEHMKRIENDRLVERITGSDVRGVKLRGRPQMGWMDDVKRALNERPMFMKQGRMIVHDRGEWRAAVNAWVLTQLWQTVDQIRCGETGAWVIYEVTGVNLRTLLWIRPPPSSLFARLT